MFGITDLGTFFAAAVFIILLPGPNSLYVLSVAAQRGAAVSSQVFYASGGTSCTRTS